MISQHQREAIETAMLRLPIKEAQALNRAVHQITGFNLSSLKWDIPQGFEEPDAEMKDAKGQSETLCKLLARFLPTKAPWQTNYTPETWERILRGLVADRKPLEIIAEINGRYPDIKDIRRIKDNHIANFRHNRENLVYALISSSESQRRAFYRESRKINEARYEKTMGVKA